MDRLKYELKCKHCKSSFSADYNATKYCAIQCHLNFYIEKINDCWVWKGNKDLAGCGQLFADKKLKKAHRVCWEIKHDVCLDGIDLVKLKDGRCTEKFCVNPDHWALYVKKDALKKRLQKILSTKEISEIEDLLRGGNFIMRSIAQIYGVERSSINEIKRGLRL